jgi:hypothetical protein
LCPPAAEKDFLGDILGVIRVAEEEPQGTYELISELREGAQ